MTAPARRDAALLTAYAATVWRVHERGGDLALRLEQPFPHAHLLPCAIITAYNPGSNPCEPSWNRAADERLYSDLTQRGLRPVRATAVGNGDDAGRWNEPGYLVSGIAADEAVAIAERFRQNAIVWIDVDALPVLLTTRAGFLGLVPGDRIPLS